MNDVPEDDLRDALRRMSGAVRPSHGATTTIHASVRRSRRRRAIGAVVGTTGLVLTIVAGGYAVTGALTDPRPTHPDRAIATAPVSGQVFECPTESRVTGQAPRIADREEQEQVVNRLRELSSVQVRYAAPSALGVVALVVDDSGDPDYWADPEVIRKLKELGAAHVYEWDGDADSDWESPEDQVDSVVGWLLDPVVEDVRRATRDIPGDAGLALWIKAGAVLLQWKAPVPQEVLALAGVRSDGVEIIVEAVRYSEKDVSRAQNRLDRVLRERGMWDDWSSSYACADGSGLIVGMVPPLTDRAELQGELTEALGLPVMIVPEERPIPLSGSRT